MPPQPKAEITVYDIITANYLKAVIAAIAIYTPFSVVDLWLYLPTSKIHR